MTCCCLWYSEARPHSYVQRLFLRKLHHSLQGLWLEWKLQQSGWITKWCHTETAEAATEINAVNRRSSCDIDQRSDDEAHLANAFEERKKERKTLMVVNVETSALVETSGHKCHHIPWVNKSAQTIMSDNRNIICAWCQSKGKTMFANLPKKNSQLDFFYSPSLKKKKSVWYI